MRYFRQPCNLLIPVVLLGFLLTGCGTGSRKDPKEESYIQSIRKWQQDRISYQKSHDGWLNLAGLFWLSEGDNLVGSGPKMTIKFPEKSPSFLGTFHLANQKVIFYAAPDVNVKEKGIPVDTIEMVPDVTMHPTLLSLDSLEWFVIKRENLFGIRLRDFSRPEIALFDSIPCFPISEKWRIKARLKAFATPYKIPVANVIGQLTEIETPGVLEFEWEGKSLQLSPLGKPGELWLIFADETSGDQTYGAGRFLEIDPPLKDGTYILDFNKAYNPPCAFTPFATCPLPPKENFLKIAVTAGEKSVPHPVAR